MANSISLMGQSEFLPFTMRFAVDIAAGFKTTEEICQKHGVDNRTFEALMRYPIFTKTVEGLALKMQQDGSIIEIKAKMYLEELLDEARIIAIDDQASDKGRMAAMELIRKCAQANKKATPVASSFTFNILNVNGQRVPEAIEIGEVAALPPENESDSEMNDDSESDQLDQDGD